ncbi:SURF1 family protein [Leekyejoonella antrihumi]|uniref:SURF1 family protein n=1 Tax=Leekyejoonella antrihumi TaxID=1660198 RepID=UPI0016489C8A|nr:SURF1 family protein [Leekyejoonella antrihumi]
MKDAGYDASKQLLVTGRLLHGTAGYWVITPLVVDGTGARVVIMRGFVRSPSQATPPTTTGDVTVVGSLAPGESPATTVPPAGQIGTIDLARLLNTWGGSLYNAFLFDIHETPNATSAGITRVPPPPPNPNSGLKLQNAVYAVQWWMFGVFAIYIYFRMMRDDYEARAAQSDPDGESDNEPTIASPTKDANA